MEKEKVAHSSFWVNFFNSPTEETDLKNSLKTIPLFNELTKRDLSALITIIHNRTYVIGEFIFHQGDPGIGLYIIREGEVMIERENDHNEKKILATFGKGDFFGELALVEGEKEHLKWFENMCMKRRINNLYKTQRPKILKNKKLLKF